MIPEFRPRIETIVTDQRHRFVRKGCMARLKLRFLREDDQPLANIRFVCVIDGRLHDGSTDADGWLDVAIPPSAEVGRVILDSGGPDEREFPIRIGHLDPHDSASGVEQRLRNLGCLPAEPHEVALALRAFQAKYALEQTGEADSPTIDKLRNIHGS